MIAGKVVGSIVATRKNDKLIGNKFMIVEIVDSMSEKAKQLIAIDNIGAGIGEYVLVAQGSAARIGCDVKDAPVDAAIVGIIDDGTRLE
jgi:ethanolamine utilization protein EutN